MSDFINTIDLLGDDIVIDSIIDKSITEFRDDKLSTLPDSAFADFDKLETIDLPNVAESASFYPFQFTFARCRALKNINMPALREGAYMFQDCTGLEYVSFPVLGAAGYCFLQNCNKLRIADFGRMSSWTSYALRWCSSLNRLVLRYNGVCTNGGTQPLAGTPLENGNHGGGRVYVPSMFIEAYQNATNWAALYAAGTCTFIALEDVTVDGTTTGALKVCEDLIFDSQELLFDTPDAKVLTATITNAPIVDDLTLWVSEDENIVYVVDGKLFPMGEGSTVVTATCGGKTARCVVTVTETGVSNILNNIQYTNGYVNNNGTFTAAASDRCTDLFDISELAGETISIELVDVPGTQTKNARIVYYSSANVAVGYTVGTANNSFITSTVPADALYARISVNISAGGTGVLITNNDNVIGRITFD